MQRSNRDHAVVIGGSLAGLLAARVLSDFYEQVTLLERDAFPTTGEQRRGVPQGRHTHGLLAGGRRILDDLFPGISQTLIDGGALPGDIVAKSRWYLEGGCHVRFASGLDGILMTRPFLEGVVRERVLELSNVRVRQGCTVQSLAASEDRRRVTGVRTGSEVLAADLVVDASGRGSHSAAWLDALGYPKPQEERVEIALGYMTRMFRRRATDLNGDTAAVIPPTPHGKQGGVMLAQEGDRWIVTLVAHFGNYPPADLPGFIEFARGLTAPFIYDVIRDAEPLGDAASARFPCSIRRRYERLDRFPEGYLVMGDAISSFNPVYGQGMSSAALQARELHTTLAENPASLHKAFFGRAAKIVDIPWSIAVGNDLRMAEVPGPRPMPVKLINWYMAKLHKAAHYDQVASMAFHQVANLLAPPPSVMHPRVVLHVFRTLVFGPASPKADLLPAVSRVRSHSA